LSSKADVRAQHVTSDGRDGSIFRLLLPGKMRHTIVRIRVQGVHNVMNALAASAVGAVFGMPGAVIAQGLARFRPAAMRSQIVLSHGIRIINDCYNANPASMKAAVQLLAQTGSGRKRISVLGDMLELGPGAVRMHEEVGSFVAQQGIDQLITCGPLARNLAEGARQAGMDRAQVLETPDAAAAAVALKATVKQGDVVLVKGSRGMKLEQVVQALQGMKRIAKQAS
jgi:UDP-N-acetylmuramoyl-tripeptide--D-alanyl-D-alanine ligase